MKNHVMISMPMSDRTEQEILETIKHVKQYLEDKGYTVVDSYFNLGKEFIADFLYMAGIEVPLYYLGKSLMAMAECDTVYFCKNWYKYRGCQIEHKAASLYGLNMLYEDEDEE